MKKRAVVLAGGRGTRLRPYTVVLPKPLMPVGDYPILEVVSRQLARHGFDHITMAVNHQADLIRAFFGDGSKWRVRIDYSLEDQPLGTMGPLRLIPDLPEHFLVMNGDVLTDLNYADFHDEHATNNRLFRISSHRLMPSATGVGPNQSADAIHVRISSRACVSPARRAWAAACSQASAAAAARASFQCNHASSRRALQRPC